MLVKTTKGHSTDKKNFSNRFSGHNMFVDMVFAETGDCKEQSTACMHTSMFIARHTTSLASPRPLGGTMRAMGYVLCPQWKPAKKKIGYAHNSSIELMPEIVEDQTHMILKNAHCRNCVLPYAQKINCSLHGARYPDGAISTTCNTISFGSWPERVASCFRPLLRYR